MKAARTTGPTPTTMGASFLIAYLAIACALRVASARQPDPCECNAYGCIGLHNELGAANSVCYVKGGLSCERARPSRCSSKFGWTPSDNCYKGEAYIDCPDGEPVYERRRTCSKAYVLTLEDARIPYKIIEEPDFFPEHSRLPMERCTSKIREYVENYGYDADNIQSIAMAAASAGSMTIADGVSFQDEVVMDGEVVKSKSSSESSVITYADEKWYVAPRNCKPYVEVCDGSQPTYDPYGNEIGYLPSPLTPFHSVPGEIAGNGTCDYEFTSLRPYCTPYTQVCIKNCPEEPAPHAGGAQASADAFASGGSTTNGWSFGLAFGK